MPKREPPEVRFWRRVDRSGDCWLWTGRVIANGYGHFDLTHDEPVLAHRMSWTLTHGPIPEGSGYHGICVLHRCDTRRCVNPAHLFLGTHRDNIQDAFAKGRIRRDGIHNPHHHEYHAGRMQ